MYTNIYQKYFYVCHFITSNHTICVTADRVGLLLKLIDNYVKQGFAL